MPTPCEQIWSDTAAEPKIWAWAPFCSKGKPWNNVCIWAGHGSQMLLSQNWKWANSCYKVSQIAWLQDTWFVAPEKGNQEAFIAMYAIATSLNKGDSALLARFVPRANGEVTLGLLTPLSGTEGCFTMNQLPFEADVRVANFTTFGKKPEVLPSKKQLASMDALLDAFGACAGCSLLQTCCAWALCVI